VDLRVQPADLVLRALWAHREPLVLDLQALWARPDPLVQQDQQVHQGLQRVQQELRVLRELQIRPQVPRGPLAQQEVLPVQREPQVLLPVLPVLAPPEQQVQQGLRISGQQVG